MGLVADALDHVEALRSAIEHHGNAGVRTVQELLALGERHELNLTIHAHARGGLLGGVQLR